MRYEPEGVREGEESGQGHGIDGPRDVLARVAGIPIAGVGKMDAPQRPCGPRDGKCGWEKWNAPERPIGETRQ